MERYSMLMNRKLNIVKMAVLPNLIYRFNAIANKTPESYMDIDKLILKCVERQKT